MQEKRLRSLGLEGPLEKEREIHSSILAWEIPWTKAGYSPWVCKRIRHNLATNTTTCGRQRPDGLRNIMMKTDTSQGSRVSMRVARASASLLSSHGRVPGTSPGSSRVFEGETA